MAKKSNWDLIRKQKDTETVKYRDVYEDQQLERGSIAKKQTMTSRIVATSFLAVLVFAASWSAISAIDHFTSKSGLDDDMNPRDDWVYVPAHYYNKRDNDTRDVLSIEDYEEWYEQYHADNISADEQVPEIPSLSPSEYLSGFRYDQYSDVYTYEDPTTYEMSSYTPDEYKSIVYEYGETYSAALDEYQAYYHRHNDPEYRADDENGGPYDKTIPYYENVKTGAFISEDQYKQLIADYDNSLASLSDDIKSIPLAPIDESSYYKGDTYKCMTNEDYWALAGLNTTSVAGVVTKEDVATFLSYCQANNIDLTKSPYPLTEQTAPDMNDKDAMARYTKYQDFKSALSTAFGKATSSTSYRDLWHTFEVYCKESHFDITTGTYADPSRIIYVAVTYKSVLDGSEISLTDVSELKNKFAQDNEAYTEAYKAHREEFHPDDISGTAKVAFTMAPSFGKVGISLALAALTFVTLIAILKKNLDAQNIMSTTDDINQYHNDQHVALPEEVQKNYDWFPDVGAHSAVQVSSMISHMAISNKGLKKVNVAKRAAKDIIDENGCVEYYKGEILRDENGDPITTSEPIIDTDFMEALFDASGAPKDPKVRHYYDPTKIPYNPGNTNRDKLQGKKKDSNGNVVKNRKGDAVSLYDTVADLINNDWEFPVYEPQRPGGAYIVDTAPVNTMVLAINSI